jgi:TonB family protein
MKLSRACAPLMALRAAPAELEDKTLREQTRPKEEDKRKVVLGDVTVSEGLSQEVVLSVIQKKILEMEKSFLASEPGGKLVLRLTIDQDGKVKNVNILSSSMKNGRFQQSIIEQLKKWQFPATQGGREARITFSLVFVS